MFTCNSVIMGSLHWVSDSHCYQDVIQILEEVVSFTVTCCLCPFNPTHPTSASKLSCTLLIWKYQLVANFFKLGHAAHQTQNSSSMSPLTDCAVIDFTTDLYQPPFNCILGHARRSNVATLLPWPIPHWGEKDDFVMILAIFPLR